MIEEGNSFNSLTLLFLECKSVWLDVHYCILYLFSGFRFVWGSVGSDTAVRSDVLLGGSTGGVVRRGIDDLPADVDLTVGASSTKFRAN